MKRSIFFSLLLSVTVVLFQNCAGGGLPDVQQDLNASRSVNGGCAFGSGTIPNHATVPAYSVASAASSALCTSAMEQRTCTDGVLSGSFAFSSCTVVVPVNSKINLTLANNATDYNVASAAGSPTTPVDVILTVNSGVTVGASSPAVAALRTGSFPAGSTVLIVNNGAILGAGGAGGNGGISLVSPTVASPGGAGGPAISLGYSVTVANNGRIGGGGGGGGGGADCRAGVGSGGGGGGAGGASGGIGSGQGVYGYPGVNGNTGTLSGPGTGGSGGVIQVPYYCNSGGDGGAFGQPGGAGAANSTYGTIYGPAAGGAAGAAIVRNGFNVTFSAGGSSPNLLGVIQ